MTAQDMREEIRGQIAQRYDTEHPGADPAERDATIDTATDVLLAQLGQQWEAQRQQMLRARVHALFGPPSR